MALSTTPTLIEINAEIGVSGYSLSEAITASGESFTKQTDFAGYSHNYFSMIPSLMNFTSQGTPAQMLGIIASRGWTLVVSESFVVTTLTGTGNADILVSCSPNTTGSLRSAILSGSLNTDATINDSISINQEPETSG